MKKFARKLAALAVLSLCATSASAVLIAAPGGTIDIPAGVNFEVASVYENAVLAVGQTLRGVGEITQINGVATSTLCSSSCELTYRFDSYVVSSIAAGAVTFTGGTLTVYLGFGANDDFNPFALGMTSITDLAAATNGSVFLNLSGHAIDAAGNTLQAVATSGSLLGPNFTFFGTGLLDVALGIGLANANFDTELGACSVWRSRRSQPKLVRPKPGGAASV